MRQAAGYARGVSAPAGMRPARTVVGVAAALALSLVGLIAAGSVAPGPVSAAEPTVSPFVEGRHVYDYGHRLSPNSLARAEGLAGRIEAEGGGRVVVYTAELTDLPDAGQLALDWQVDGVLLTGWSDFGEATLGATLRGKLPAGTEKFMDSTSSTLTSFETWATSILARTDGLLNGRHVFDAPGVLDADGLTHAEASANRLSAKIGIPVYVDVAVGDAGNPQGTAYWNSDLSDGLGTSLVIALAVSNGRIGGRVQAATGYDSSYETGAPWSFGTLWSEDAPGGDVQAELLRAIDAVGTPIDPAEVVKRVEDEANAARDAVGRFFSDKTNQQYSIGGLLLALLALVAFGLDRWRRRRETGFGDDDSILLPAPPAEMTPALAALVASPLDTTRAVTTALLDLAAHGRIAFYQRQTPLGPSGGIKVLSTAAGGSDPAAYSASMDRPLGPAESSLLDGLRRAAGRPGRAAGADIAGLRPVFEQTGEQLERIAGERGWLRLKARSVSRPWLAAGVALLIGAVAAALIAQPVAAGALWIASAGILPRAGRMPLPVRTPDGQLTASMVGAYRRTLRKALAGAPGTVPPWLASAEEAALWGYAWGLEGEVQALVARNVAGTLAYPEAAGLTDEAGAAGLAAWTTLLGGVAAAGPARPVGLDTDAIASTLGGLGRSLEAQAGENTERSGDSGTARP
ncbi:MAG: hypothetical protein ACXWNR_01515 [Candidatus Limnocylindrales bacterium]